jgi:hypothetical protein
MLTKFSTRTRVSWISAQKVKEINPCILRLAEARQTFVGARVKAGTEGSVGNNIRTVVHGNQQRHARAQLEAELSEGLACV